MMIGITVDRAMCDGLCWVSGWLKICEQITHCITYHKVRLSFMLQHLAHIGDEVGVATRNLHVCM